MCLARDHADKQKSDNCIRPSHVEKVLVDQLSNLAWDRNGKSQVMPSVSTICPGARGSTSGICDSVFREGRTGTRACDAFEIEGEFTYSDIPTEQAFMHATERA